MDDEMWSTIHRIMAYQFDHAENLPVYADLSKQEVDQVTPAYAFIGELKAKYPYVSVNNASCMLS